MAVAINHRAPVRTSAVTYQRTLQKPVSLAGIGLHSGRQVSLLIRPSSAGSGICFIRKDIKTGPVRIPALWCNVINTHYSTILANAADIAVGTVEHLMAALYGCGIDNASIELDGPEVPIMDGSALPFVNAIEQSGIIEQPAPRQYIQVLRPVYVTSGDKLALLVPSTSSRLSLDIHFPHPAVGFQSLSIPFYQRNFKRRLAPARSFGFLDELEQLRAAGLIHGGSLHNAVVFDEQGVMNDGGLRFHDECVRHKLLDCVGDLALAGAPILGHFYGYKTGHALNNRLLHRLFAETETWCFSYSQPAPDTPSWYPVKARRACGEARRWLESGLSGSINTPGKR